MIYFNSFITLIIKHPDQITFIYVTHSPLLTSIEDYDLPIFVTEDIGFDDISDEVSDDTIPCTESLVMTPLKDDIETQELSCHNIPTSFKNKGQLFFLLI